jgi:hypothetical protein
MWYAENEAGYPAAALEAAEEHKNKELTHA